MYFFTGQRNTSITQAFPAKSSHFRAYFAAEGVVGVGLCDSSARVRERYNVAVGVIAVILVRLSNSHPVALFFTLFDYIEPKIVKKDKRQIIVLY